MTRVAVSRLINATPETVFDAVCNIENLPATNPDVVGIEFLTEQKSGAGTRFRETRRMKDKEMVTELEVTEWTHGRHARMVADSHGTVWDTVFSVEPKGDQTELRLVMDARAHAFLPKLLNPLMKGFFRKGMDGHLTHVKAYCEGQPG
ncbi:MAG: SRPBCC family protein [Acidobacteriota bacterium]